MFEKTRALFGRGGRATPAETAEVQAPLEDSGVERQAASQLAPVAQPKVKTGHSSFPSYLTTTRPTASPLPKSDRRLANTDVTSYRTGASTSDVIRDFAAASPDMSAALFAYLRVGIPNSYTAVAKNAADGTFNPEATTLLQQVITRMDVLPDYSDGFSGTWSLRSLSESLAKQIVLNGAMAGELVLDKSRLPSRIQPISVTQVQFIPDNDILRPIQLLGGQRIDLDIPTFIYVSLDQDLRDAYAASFMEPAIKATIFAEDFIQDLQKIAKRAVHPRLYIKLAEEAIRKNGPPEAMHDSNALTEYLNGVLKTVEDTVNGLSPEDALIMFDSIEPDYLNNGNISIGAEWKTLQDIVNARLATGAKTMPAVLGHSAASQNIASTESMLFMKSAAGAVTAKLNEFYSRMFTLALRLFGLDVTVTFEYDAIDMRPDAELEAFRQTKQSRILELLSLGMLTDEEACLKLTGRLPPQGYKPLAGTMFKSAQGAANPNPNGDSNGGSAMAKDQAAGTPTQGRGQNNKSNPQGV